MRKIKTIKDVVEWGLCIGCGACQYACNNNAIILENFYDKGIRPVVDTEKCMSEGDCLDVCSGLQIDARLIKDSSYKPLHEDLEFGPYLELWEGYAVDSEIRKAASSGGALTALALYCLEKEEMLFTLHSEMDPNKPWENKTVLSRTRQDLITRTGSRYAPASPCDGLSLIENSDRECVFIGKPCDTAAATMARKKNQKLNQNLGLVLSFFCAGAPSTRATLDLMNKMNINSKQVKAIRYRGNGWPGEFKVTLYDNAVDKTMSYMDSWHELQRYRPFRCHLCPDGLGQIADLSCGDAWHRYKNNQNPGQSIIIVRTEKGRAILHKAMENNYLHLSRIEVSQVIKAQGLLNRKQEIFGRLLAMKLLIIPIPKIIGFALFKSWLKLGILRKITTIIGTLRRLIQRQYWHKNKLK